MRRAQRRRQQTSLKDGCRGCIFEEEGFGRHRNAIASLPATVLVSISGRPYTGGYMEHYFLY